MRSSSGGKAEYSKVCLAHHWIAAMRGGERVLAALSGFFPSAPIHTLVADRAVVRANFPGVRVVTSPLGALPLATRFYKLLLPFHPLFYRMIRLPKGLAALITSDAALAKTIRPPTGAAHVCYCHLPPRYLWDREAREVYFAARSARSALVRSLLAAFTPALRSADLAGAATVDHFIANSAFIARRIKESYGRESDVIHPPVDVGRFNRAAAEIRPECGGFVFLGELVPYNRPDLAIEAFRRNGLPLLVIGGGRALERMRAGAPRNVRFMGRVSGGQLPALLAGAEALIHPQLEDFGIAAVEAQAAGLPVIAFRGGGAIETVRGLGESYEQPTGLFFDQQTPESLADAVARFMRERARFSKEAGIGNAARFSMERLAHEFRNW